MLTLSALCAHALINRDDYDYDSYSPLVRMYLDEFTEKYNEIAEAFAAQTLQIYGGVFHVYEFIIGPSPYLSWLSQRAMLGLTPYEPLQGKHLARFMSSMDLSGYSLHDSEWDHICILVSAVVNVCFPLLREIAAKK